MRVSTELLRVVRFGIVGVAATATHVGTTLLLVETAGLSPELATTLGMTLAMWVSYFGHQMFTFGVAADHRTMPIRLTHTPTTCWMYPVARIKRGIGRRFGPACDSQQ